MCVVLPVIHIACVHKETVWQHCIEATRTSEVHSIEPCGHEREHARPIMTRKPCHECGGQRYFARRGGIAERGSGSEVSFLEMLGQEDWNVKMLGRREDYADSNDSGYHSEITLEEMDGESGEEEEEEVALSPKTSPTTSTRLRRARAHSNLNRGYQKPRSTPSDGSWSPKLKTELQSTASSTTVNPIPLAMQSVPRLKDPRPPPPDRKGSTLLHPSAPIDTTPTVTSRPSFYRKPSTLLHPSSPPETPLPARSLTPFPLLKTTNPTPSQQTSILTPPTTPSPTPSPFFRAPTPFPFIPAPVFSAPLGSSIRRQLSSHSLFVDGGIDMSGNGDKKAGKEVGGVDMNLDMDFSLDFGPGRLHSSHSDDEGEEEEGKGRARHTAAYEEKANRRKGMYSPPQSFFEWDESEDEDSNEIDEQEQGDGKLSGTGVIVTAGDVNKGLGVIMAQTAKVARASRISYPYHGRAPQGVVPR